MKTGLFVVAFCRIYPQGSKALNVGDIITAGKNTENKPQTVRNARKPPKSGNVRTEGKTRKAVDLIGVRSYINIVKKPLSAPSAIFRKSLFLRLLRFLRCFEYVKKYFQKNT